MKRILAVILALTLALSMTVFVSAADEIEIPLDEEHVGSGCATVDQLTLGDNSITAVTGTDVGIFAITLPEPVAIGETVVVHIKGSSDGDFRIWLLTGGQSTFSNQYKMSDNGFVAPGEFEKYIELTAEDFDSVGGTEADRVSFKAPSYDTKLENLTLTYAGVIYGTMADVEGEASAEAQPFADAAAAALAAAQAANGDEAALQAALADAQAAVDALTEKAALGFPSVTELLNTANANVREINKLISDAKAAEVLAGIQGDIDAVNNALAAAQAPGADPADIRAALADAQAAADRIAEVADGSNYDAVISASRDAKNTLREIQNVLDDAEEAQKQAQKEADEAAAKAKQTTTVIIIVVVAVVIIAVIAVVIVMALKKKK